MIIEKETQVAFESALDSLEPLWSAAYDEGVARRVELPNATLKSCILRTVEQQASEVHVVYKERELTFAETNEHACRLANGLMASGLRKGDAVCVFLGDNPELIITYMACYKAGFIAVGLNPRSTVDELARRLRDSSARAIVVSSSVVRVTLAGLANSGANAEIVIFVDDDAGTKVSSRGSREVPSCDAMSSGCVQIIPWAHFLASASSNEPEVSLSPSDVAVMIYTGGTTGVPKGCPLTHQMLIWAQYFFYSFLAPRLGGARSMTSLLTSPMTHAYGMDFGVNWGIVIGGKVVIAHSLDGPTILQLIRKQQVTVWGAVPAMIALFCEELERMGGEVPSLAVAVVSCATASSSVLDRFCRLCEHVTLVQDYGMTETSGPVTLTPVVRGMSRGSVGVPVENTDILVVDFETGTLAVPQGECGEVIFRGPQIIGEYWKAPGETAKAFRGEWLYSGDVGYFDEKGFLHVVDRIKDVIEVSGFSVFPREIDEVIHDHPQVVDTCTIGVPDDKSGERPKSFVVRDTGCQLSEQDIIDYCHEHLIAYKCPKYVEFVDCIPLTINGKPNKCELRRREESKRKQQVA